MTEATIGYGLTIRIGRGDPVAWTTLEELKDIEWPQNEADEHEVTHMASPGRTKEFIAGLIDNGEVTIPMNWVPGSVTDTLLSEIQASGELVQIEITAANSGFVPEVYVGFCKRYARMSPVNGPQTADATFRINGIVTP
jgi:hypothetical protein